MEARGSTTGGQEQLLITRTFTAPRELVWKVWTEPALIRRWWGPAGFTCPAATIGLRNGGTYLYAMRSPEGKDFWSTGTFREVIPYERIVAADSFADEKGTIVPASAYSMPGDWPEALLVTLEFTEDQGKTTLVLRHEGFPAGEQAALARAGWLQSLDKFARVLIEEQAASGTTLVIAETDRHDVSQARIFPAPRDRVFRALTDPALIAKWWAPRRFVTIVETFEPRPGGRWRFLNRDDAGNVFAFHGVYHEVTSSRIVYTFEFEGMPGHALLAIVTLEDRADRTLFIATSVFETPGDRDGMLAISLASGGLEPMDMLAELVER